MTQLRWKRLKSGKLRLQYREQIGLYASGGPMYCKWRPVKTYRSKPKKKAREFYIYTNDYGEKLAVENPSEHFFIDYAGKYLKVREVEK